MEISKTFNRDQRTIKKNLREIKRALINESGFDKKVFEASVKKKTNL